MKNLNFYQSAIRWYLFDRKRWHTIVYLKSSVLSFVFINLAAHEAYGTLTKGICISIGILFMAVFVFGTSVGTLANLWEESNAVFYSKRKIRKNYYSPEEIDRLNQYLSPFRFITNNCEEICKSMQRCFQEGNGSVMNLQEMSDIYEAIFATRFEDLPLVENSTKRGSFALMWRYEIGK